MRIFATNTFKMTVKLNITIEEDIVNKINRDQINTHNY